MKAKPIFFGYSWVGLLNQILLQWFFIRLQCTANGNNEIIRYQIMGFVLPLTGWWSDYVWLTKKFEIG